MKELHEIARTLHIVMATLHGVGLVYALHRGNRWDGCVHVCAGAFSLRAARHHAREAQ